MNTSEFEITRKSVERGGTSHKTAFTIFSLTEVITGSLFNGVVIFVLFF